MTINHFEIFVEEPSMEAFLLGAIPRILPEHITFSIFTYNGKSDLLRKFPDRLRGYSAWLPENYAIIALVDRDDDDCIELKARLEDFFATAKIPTKQQSNHGLSSGLTRIAVEELEAWYFGNWPAVLRSYPKLPTNVISKVGYRKSDEIQGGTWEAFERVCKKHGLFSSGLRKVEAARAIGGQIDIKENTSPSFQSFFDGLVALLK